jgi:hypothetical protein
MMEHLQNTIIISKRTGIFFLIVSLITIISYGIAYGINESCETDYQNTKLDLVCMATNYKVNFNRGPKGNPDIFTGEIFGSYLFNNMTHRCRINYFGNCDHKRLKGSSETNEHANLVVTNCLSRYYPLNNRFFCNANMESEICNIKSFDCNGEKKSVKDSFKAFIILLIITGCFFVLHVLTYLIWRLAKI